MLRVSGFGAWDSGIKGSRFGVFKPLVFGSSRPRAGVQRRMPKHLNPNPYWSEDFVSRLMTGIIGDITQLIGVISILTMSP